MDQDNNGKVQPAPSWLDRHAYWLLPMIGASLISAALVVSTSKARRHATPAAAAALAFADDPRLSDAERVARWAVASGDAGHRPFVVIDKVNARVSAFEASGQLRERSPALLGLARGDDSVPGIGQRKMADIKPAERITPAGRFVAERGTNLSGEDIVWIDYDAAVSMHRVRPTVASERRLQRLASPSAGDNRISYGCVNLPPAFYEKVISPMVSSGKVVVYVLPEVHPLSNVFALDQKGSVHAAL
ncbi:MAG: hypothetical protein ABI605_05705 [Rhizobacter sp.]